MPKEGAGDRSDSAEFDRCAHCGRELGTDEWHPVDTVENPDGSLSFDAFCDDDCRDAYVRERRDAPSVKAEE